MQTAENVGDWNVTQLTKFIQQIIEQYNAGKTANQLAEQMTVTRQLVIADEIKFAQPIYTVGAAGQGATPPATPEIYVKVLDPLGQVRQIPLYKIA